MNYDENIYAEVVFDGTETYAPARMGTPKPDQLQGTTFEELIELAGRVCYDSLGKGRGSAAYHAHILEVGHGSVWEHANFTVEFTDSQGRDLGRELFPVLLNRPGVWVEHHQTDVVRVTLNMRSALEWDEWAGGHNLGPIKLLEATVRAGVLSAAERLAPTLVGTAMLAASGLVDSAVTSQLVRPEHPEEKWVSLLLGGSRGMSHEQVRHKWRTAVSQRSTRYVDESTSPWVEHPLVTQARADGGVTIGTAVASFQRGVTSMAQSAYTAMVETLQPWLEGRGIDKHTARKQSRGAARGLLGNALHTELIFSASVAQWRRMFVMRCSPHADAEIREVYARAFQALKTTKWADDFADLKLVPSPDGIGEVIE